MVNGSEVVDGALMLDSWMYFGEKILEGGKGGLLCGFRRSDLLGMVSFRGSRILVKYGNVPFGV
jgi:hypothetical protein